MGGREILEGKVFHFPKVIKQISPNNGSRIILLGSPYLGRSMKILIRQGHTKVSLWINHP